MLLSLIPSFTFGFVLVPAGFRNGTFMATADEQGLVHLFDIEQPLQRGAEGGKAPCSNAWS